MGIFRSISFCSIVAFATSLACPGPAMAEDAPITIVDLGDSYIIGHGIAAGETFPVRLQAAQGLSNQAGSACGGSRRQMSGWRCWQSRQAMQ